MWTIYVCLKHIFDSNLQQGARNTFTLSSMKEEIFINIVCDCGNILIVIRASSITENPPQIALFVENLGALYACVSVCICVYVTSMQIICIEHRSYVYRLGRFNAFELAF